jgi:PAS domain S-box-containing protein
MTIKPAEDEPMNPGEAALPKMPGKYWDIIIIVSSAIILLLTFYCLLAGITTVFMHLYYFPIILLAYRYQKKGVAYSVILSLLYFFMVVWFQHSQVIEISGALLRVLSFTGVAIVVAYLSIIISHKQQEYLGVSRFNESIVSNANVLLAVLDAKGNILVWNRAAEEISGYRAGEVTGKNAIWKQLYPDPDYRKKVTGTITTILEEKKFFENFETVIVAKDGGNKTISWNTRVIPDKQGVSHRFVAIGIDVTGRRQAEEELNHATKKLGLLNAITFTDIQNAIFSLSGYLELETLSPMDEKLQKNVEKQMKIVKAISESLKFADLYQSLGLKTPAWQNVEQSFLLAISHLDFSKLSRQIMVGGLEIYADPLLENVFFTLAGNVVLHGNTATELTFRYMESAEGLTLFFEDNGVGIHTDMKEKIFDRRYKEKKGIGLFLVREILSITGITIRETGEPGKGARFEILVPKGVYRFIDRT